MACKDHYLQCPSNSICRVLASLIWNRDLVDQGIHRVALRFLDPWIRIIIDWAGRVSVKKSYADGDIQDILPAIYH